MSKDAPFAVEVPASGRDHPGWVKVGVIAAVGFIIGIAWPRLVGVRLGPAAPGEAAAAAASASASAARGGRAPEAPPASVVTKGPAASAVPAASSAPAPAPVATGGAAPNITVQKGTVMSCKTADGDTKKGKECGSVAGFDQIVSPRVRKIASCAGAEGQTGKLSLVVNADFASSRFWFDVGKSSTVANPDAIAACLKTSFHGTSTSSIAHEHPRYTVAYTAVFAPGASEDDKAVAHKDKADKPSEKDKAERSAKESDGEKKEEKSERSELASGEAQVAWEVALVRDAPKSSTLVARLPRGTKVKVGAAKDGWFQIKFGEGNANDGWVYRGAIGR